jgi:hypothetical protein
MAMARPAAFGTATLAGLWHLAAWLAVAPALLLAAHLLMTRRLIR